MNATAGWHLGSKEKKCNFSRAVTSDLLQFYRSSLSSKAITISETQLTGRNLL